MISDEDRRRILVEALDLRITAYEMHARDMHMLNAQKPGHGFDQAAAEYRHMAEIARQIRDEIKEG